MTIRCKTGIHRLLVGGQTIDLLAPVDPDALLEAAGVLVETRNIERENFGGGRWAGQCYVLRFAK